MLDCTNKKKSNMEEVLDLQAEKERKHKIIAKNLEVIEKLLIFTPSECMY